MKSVWQKLKSFPHFLYLFPLFFVFHNYVQNRNAVTATDFYELYAEYLGATLVLFLLGWVIFKNQRKAALFAFSLMFYHFFFGAMHYALKRMAENFFLAKYSVLLPFSFALFVLLFLFLKRTTKRFSRFVLYLNAALAVLLAIDLPPLFQQPAQLTQLKLCDTCARPDVYFIVADEYADSVSLSQAFGYNNGRFQAELRNRGFYLVNKSRANYNFTQYAVASLFKMDYLPNLDRRYSSKKDINTCYGTVNENELLLFFKKSGYAVKNFSVFNVANEPAKAEYKFVPMGKALISSQTFLQRIKRDIGYHFVTTLKLNSLIARYAYYTRENNKALLQLLREEAHRRSPQPRFVFTHVEMPHYPYYYDSSGRERPLAALVASGSERDGEAYVEYVKYANKVYLQAIDDILQHAARPPVVVFMGDHGFRAFNVDNATNRNYYFMNINAVLLPNKNYAPFYEGLSGVNQFRALLNAAFGQNLSFLKDSSVYVVD